MRWIESPISIKRRGRSRRRPPSKTCPLDRKPYSRILNLVKTTIDIPDPLYKRAKIHAVETGRTLKELVLTSLERELAPSRVAVGEEASYWANRKLLPEFQAALEAGAFSGGTDSAEIISEERDAR